MIEYAGGRITVHHGDALRDVLRADTLGYDYRLGYAPPLVRTASMDAVVTDPPYGLEFMGKEWDRFDGGQQARWQGRKMGERFDHDGMGAETLVARLAARPSYGGDTRGHKCMTCGHYKFSSKPCTCPNPQWEVRTGTPPNMTAFQQWCEEWAAECLRVLKPGGHLLAFGGTRTWHRLTCAIEDAGFEIRDTITWLYGSGFPKSLDVGKAIDKRPGVSRHREFAAHLAERRQAVGLSRAHVSERVVGTRSGACWNWEHHQFPEARWWPALRDLLGLRESWGEVIAQAEREATGINPNIAGRAERANPVPIGGHHRDDRTTAPATEDAARWDGWGTALKPASEPIVVARKPLAGTVAQTVLAHGTGALNINGCRVGDPDDKRAAGTKTYTPSGMAGGEPTRREVQAAPHDGLGRWPSNVVLSHAADCQPTGTRKVRSPGTGSAAASNSDGSIHGTGDGATYLTMKPSTTHYGADGMETVEAWECVPGCPVAELDAQSGMQRDGSTRIQHGFRREYVNGQGADAGLPPAGYGGEGGASRYFPVFRYQAKADTVQRPRAGQTAHPTVKPLDLMRWLVRLVTPPGGTVLDPFAGSGTTGEAALLEGFRAVLIEREADYLPLIADRLTKRTDPVTHLTAKAARGEDVDLGLFALLEPEDTAHDRALAELQDRDYEPWPGEEGP